MKRSLFLVGLVFTALELGLDALVLFALFDLAPGEGVAGAWSLAPVLGVSSAYWLVFLNRWLRDVDGSRGDEAAREAVVRFPRRSLLYRTGAVAALGVLLAPTLAGLFGVGLEAAGIIAGTISCVGLATNAVRTFAYRRVLAARATELFSEQPLRYAARCLREQLFVGTTIVATVGVAAAVLYARHLVGVSLADLAFAAALAPGVAVLTVGLAGLDMFLATRALLPFLVPDRHPGAAAPPAVVLRLASTAPYRSALAALVAYAVGGAIAAGVHASRGGLVSESLQLFAGAVAIGIALSPFQLAWHRRVLQPVRDAAAASLVAAESRPLRSRLSLRTKLVASFVVLIAFGGTFAGLGTYSEHERFLSATATADALARRTTLAEALARTPDARLLPDRLEALALEVSSPGALVVALRDGRAAGVPLPPTLAARLHEGVAGHGGVPRLRASLAFVPAGDGAALAALTPWRDAEPGRFPPLVFVFVALGLASAGLVLVAVQELTGPLRALADDARRLGQGELGQAIPPRDSDELGELAAAMEWTRRELAAKLRSIGELNASLEQRVHERTAELERANRELQATLGELRSAREEIVHAEKMASLGRLVAGVAHELNNPLNFVQNGLAPLRQSLEKLGGQGPEGRQELNDAGELLRVMGNGVQRMAAIVRALRDFSRVSPGDAVESVDLERLVDDAAALLQHDLKGRIELVKDLEPVPVPCQPGPMTQVFMNLFKNAAQAIDGPGRIEVRSRTSPGGVEIVVADSGPGIPAEDLPKIFEPFFTTKKVGEGTGLGLAIVHGIVEKHGGSIRCSSEPGRGTRFTLCLPAKATSPGA